MPSSLVAPPTFAAPPPLTRSAFRSTFSRTRRRRALPLNPPRPAQFAFPFTHPQRRKYVTPRPTNVTVVSQDAFLQCVQCLAVYHVEPEELEGVARVVACSACLHEWYATEDDLMWGNEQAKAALARAAEQGDGTNAFVAARGVENQEQDEKDDGPINVFVGNLSFRATEEDLYRAFSGYGAVLNCEVPSDSSGLPKGYAFVEMQSRRSGMKAIECLQGASIVGRDVSLSEAKPKQRSGKKGTAKSKPKRRSRHTATQEDEQLAADVTATQKP